MGDGLGEQSKEIFFLVYLLLYFERDRDSVSRGGAERETERETERERQRIPSRLCPVSMEPDAGLDLADREIMT